MRHRSRRSRPIPLAAAIAFALLAWPAPAAAALKSIWGPTQLPDATSAFPTYAELGVDVLQLQLVWSRAAPERPMVASDPNDPAYRWPAALATAIAEGAEHGIEVALLVRASPAWAVGEPAAGATTQATAPVDVADYADFLTAASRRYPQVRRWMVWGEPNRNAQWASGPIAYADLLDAAYGAIKSVDPADVVVSGMSMSFGDTPPAAWIAALRRSDGSRPRLDEYGHNPFGHRCPDLALPPDPAAPGARDIGDLDTLIGEVRAALGPGVAIWLSEFTVSSDRPSWALPFFVSRAEQAEWLARAFAIAGSLDYVTGIGWFNLLDRPEPDGLTTGLIAHAGERKPAFDAYRAARLDGSARIAACAAPAVSPATAAAPVGAGLQDAVVGQVARRSPRASLAVALRARRAARLATVLRRGYRMRIDCNRACDARASLVLGPRRARAVGLRPRRRRIAHAARALEGRGRALTLRPARRLAHRLRRRAPLRLTLSVVARADTADVRRVRRRVILR